jgi:hypothetical protein
MKRYKIQYPISDYTFPREALIHKVRFDSEYIQDHHGFAWWNGLESRNKGSCPLVTPKTHEEPKLFVLS